MANLNSEQDGPQKLAEIIQESKTILSELQEHRRAAENHKENLSEIVTLARTIIAEVQSAKTVAIAAQTKIVDDQTVIATKSAHIQNAQEHADKVRSELDRMQISASKLLTQIESHLEETNSLNETATELAKSVAENSKSSDAALLEANEARDGSIAASQKANALAEIAERIEEQINKYEKNLASFDKQAKSQLENINGLLPGATVAGLAHAFDDRRKTFLKPSSRWQWIFVSAIILIITLALTGLSNVYDKNQILGWDAIARVWVARIPIAGALIWLALHSSREAALSKRLEEDYGYKAAIAASFLGFQRQMTEIGDEAGQGTPLAKLCEDTLRTIASPPGRIYDKHNLTVTPAGEAANAAATAIGKAMGSEAK